MKKHVVSSRGNMPRDALLLTDRKPETHSRQFFSHFPVGNIGRNVPGVEPEPGAAARQVSIKRALTRNMIKLINIL